MAKKKHVRQFSYVKMSDSLMRPMKIATFPLENGERPKLRQSLEIVEDFPCEAKNLGHL